MRAGTTLGKHRRLLGPEELLRLIGLAFQGVRTVARLLDVKQSLGAGDSPFTEAINAALDQPSAEWELEL